MDSTASLIELETQSTKESNINVKMSAFSALMQDEEEEDENAFYL